MVTIPTPREGLPNDLISFSYLGAATVFALALLCAGQGSSIIATVAGQTVSEGFIHWRISVRPSFLFPAII